MFSTIVISAIVIGPTARLDERHNSGYNCGMQVGEGDAGAKSRGEAVAETRQDAEKRWVRLLVLRVLLPRSVAGLGKILDKAINTLASSPDADAALRRQFPEIRPSKLELRRARLRRNKLWNAFVHAQSNAEAKNRRESELSSWMDSFIAEVYKAAARNSISLGLVKERAVQRKAVSALASESSSDRVVPSGDYTMANDAAMWRAAAETWRETSSRMDALEKRIEKLSLTLAGEV